MAQWKTLATFEGPSLMFVRIGPFWLFSTKVNKFAQ
jgi:hypothetical protein